MTVIEVRDLEVGYGAVPVLHGIDLDLGEAEFAAVLGANGAGKTTCMRALSGMLPHRGSYSLHGRPVRRATPDQLVRRGLAHVPEGRGTFTQLTVEENLRLGAYSRTDDEVSADIAKWLDQFPRLGERLKQPAGTMSGGEQQMLAVARALMARPTVLLLDEPSMGLAPKVTQELFEALQEINQRQGVAMLVVEQNARLVLEYASRAFVLVEGKIRLSGDSAEIRDDAGLLHAYLGGE